MNIEKINKAAIHLVNDEKVTLSTGLPNSQKELENIIRLQSEWDSNSESISFLPLNRLNSKEEREKGNAIIQQVIQTGQFTSGPYVDDIEQSLGQFYDGYCIATSSGTDALKIALKALNIGHGDEVIVPLNSFAATENAIFSVGAVPVFINIDDSHNINYSEIQQLITDKTKAVIAVCLYGSTKNIKESYDIAKENNLKMIIDAAQCFGIKEILNYADVLALSFNPFKNIGSFGKSGALITRSEKIENIARMYSYHGFINKKKNVKGITWGYNSRMDNMQAAILKEKLNHFSLNALKRCYLAQRYIQKLQKLEIENHIILPIEKTNNTWHLFPLVLTDKRRDDLISFAKCKNIEFDVYYPILGHKYSTEYTRSYNSSISFHFSENLHDRTLHIPLHNHMSLDEQNKIIELLYEYFK